jgi:hypothetical protein
MLELLAKINFTKSETRELKQAMDAAAEVCRYAASGH